VYAKGWATKEEKVNQRYELAKFSRKINMVRRNKRREGEDYKSERLEVFILERMV
jgi:hypothetical protein